MVSIGDTCNLHEMSSLFLWGKIRENISLSSAEFTHSAVIVKLHLRINSDLKKKNTITRNLNVYHVGY